MADTLRNKFETWARDLFGKFYPLTKDEDGYKDKVTRWAFMAFKAGVASRPAKVGDEGMFSKDWKSGYSVGFEVAKRLFNGDDSNSPEIEGIADRGKAATEISELKRCFLQADEKRRKEANEYPLHAAKKEK